MAGWECVADPVGDGSAVCGFCTGTFDSDTTHLELSDNGVSVVVCGDCVPAFIRFAEEEGPPGMAALLLQAWLS
jgi:hypothetical protein